MQATKQVNNLIRLILPQADEWNLKQAHGGAPTAADLIYDDAQHISCRDEFTLNLSNTPNGQWSAMFHRTWSAYYGESANRPMVHGAKLMIKCDLCELPTYARMTRVVIAETNRIYAPLLQFDGDRQVATQRRHKVARVWIEEWKNPGVVFKPNREGELEREMFMRQRERKYNELLEEIAKCEVTATLGILAADDLHDLQKRMDEEQS